MTEATPIRRDDDSRKIPISLVLGSGGARGYAHVGVIEELIAQGFDIRSIAGSSMGALVGGVYAAGKLNAYRDWVLQLAKFDVFKLLDITISGGGFIKGDRIINALREHVGDVAIEDLPISYTAVAVDLDAHREVWFSHGSLFDAIRASIAIPTVFRPHRYQGRLLVDGGLLNPLPVSPTLRDFTAATIAVDVNGAEEPLDASSAGEVGPGIDAHGELPVEGENEEQVRVGNRMSRMFGSWFGSDKTSTETPDPSILELFARTLDTVQETITRLKLAAQPPDLLITIPRNASTFYDFHRAESLIELGRQRTRKALEVWSPKPGNRLLR
ncbi:MAG TPA: patatin-like phospholipase family protein [Dokdonella sp.]|uniref:patatin-like phospholipase family protein n=1 Tax=Dokdonella sp. TaxID=2291710 RepID=UPI002D80DFE9|nr:patatin-like phospholipase family protein [Dokdonella sp.]HET9034381.1 patatin-like phospholipase family protein [Dokdonella sp.]